MSISNEHIHDAVNKVGKSADIAVDKLRQLHGKLAGFEATAAEIAALVPQLKRVERAVDGVGERIIRSPVTILFVLALVGLGFALGYVFAGL